MPSDLISRVYNAQSLEDIIDIKCCFVLIFVGSLNIFKNIFYGCKSL